MSTPRNSNDSSGVTSSTRQALNFRPILRIINDGYENTFAQLIIDIATKYGINLKDIRNIISVSKLTEESYKKDKGLVRLLSKDPKVVADQISKYANRAKGRLDK